MPPPPPPADLLPMYRFGGDSWRPASAQTGQQQSDFSFRHDNAQAPRYPRGGDYDEKSTRSNGYFPHEGGRPPYSQSRPNGYINSGGRRQDRGANRYGRGRGGRGFPATAERPLLRSTRGSTPEQMTGMTEEQRNHRRFMVSNDISDSEEKDMEESEPEETYRPPEPGDFTILDSDLANGNRTENDSEPARKKQLREMNGDDSTHGESVPKWSNPDPYTVLPPPDESRKKKKDVVKLIRRARIAAEQEVTSSNAVVANDDFISLNFEDETNPMNGDVSDSDDSDRKGRGVPGAPSGPRQFSHSSTLHGQSQGNAPGTTGIAVSAGSLGPPPVYEPTLQGKRARPADEVWPPPDTEAALGNRKRTHDDQLKVEVSPRSRRKKGGKAAHADGSVVSQWKVRGTTPGTPWCVTNYAKVENIGYGFHQEICDFYDFVKPRKYEDIMRNELLQRLRYTIRKEFANCDLQCFGSFAAGLYLPNADMDLVVVSESFMNRNRKQICQSKTAMRNFADFLKHEQVPEQGSVEMIFGAKVPLIKFVDRITGLKVDLSFENDTGIIANGTFADWKARFPAMPIIVTLIKQFLMMRGLNEVAHGGLGGFSVTCLVTSLLQNMPEVHSGALIPERHLGFILMEFFNLYGNEFNTTTTGIRLHPPGYFDKRTAPGRPYQANKLHRLAIIDPNRPDNDISGGTKNILTILEHFAEAHRTLQRRMAALNNADFTNKDDESILGVILAGNYSAFETQRNRLRRLYEERLGEFDERFEGPIRGGYTASTKSSDHARGSSTAQPVDRGHKNPPGVLPPKPKTKPKPQSEPTGTSEIANKPWTNEAAARARAVVLKKEFPGIKNVPRAISKSQRRKLIAQYEAIDGTFQNDEPKILTHSQQARASATTSSRTKHVGRTAAAQSNIGTVFKGSGGASTNDPIEID
ncbi:MAG: hypothetical protein M1830_005525 [Pleopsidium flavum]|nr:MAG: hypothetical protein M1830_005525 [Pleopsidium flavum]